MCTNSKGILVLFGNYRLFSSSNVSYSNLNNFNKSRYASRSKVGNWLNEKADTNKKLEISSEQKTAFGAGILTVVSLLVLLKGGKGVSTLLKKLKPSNLFSGLKSKVATLSSSVNSLKTKVCENLSSVSSNIKDGMKNIGSKVLKLFNTRNN